MVVELVDVELKGAFVPTKSPEKYRPNLVHVLGRKSSKHPIGAVRRRRLEQLEELLVRLFPSFAWCPFFKSVNYPHMQVNGQDARFL